MMECLEVVDLNDMMPMHMLQPTSDGVPSGIVDMIGTWIGLVDFDLLKMLHIQRLNRQRQLQQPTTTLLRT